MIAGLLRFLAGGIMVKILICQYILIFLIYLSQRRWDQVFYWAGAAILNVGVLLGIQRVVQ